MALHRWGYPLFQVPWIPLENHPSTQTKGIYRIIQQIPLKTRKMAYKNPLTRAENKSVMRLPYSQGGVKFPTGGKPLWQARERPFRYIVGKGTADPV